MKEQFAIQDVSVRDVLRARTNEAHNRLHRHSSFVGLFKQSLGLQEYRALIRRFHGFYAPLDEAIERVLAAQSRQSNGYGYAKRAGLLAQDMIDLGFTEEDVTRNSQCEAAFNVVSPASLGGVLYVVEGATLGGTSIDRAAQKLLSDDLPDGRRYWAWCRAVNKHRWAITTRYLEQMHADGTSLTDLSDGARDTFELLAEWLAPLDRPQPASERRSA